MNLYNIVFSHHAPKGSASGIKCMVLAENVEQVYDWLASEPETREGTLYTGWKYLDEAERKRIINMEGTIYDDTIDFSDAYYGLTLYGWELLKENVTGDYSELIEMELIYQI